jgi:nucleoside phosphorylase
MKILVCFALKEEAAPFQKMVGTNPAIEILLVGIGRENASRTLRAALSEKTPALVLTCGFAGGLNPELKLGTVVFASEVARLYARFISTGAKPAVFFCAESIATTVAEKKQLYLQTRADAVEMESGVIQEVCLAANIPCATVRVISDTATEDLPLDFNALAKPDKNLDFGKLAWAIARSPGKLKGLLRLQKNTAFAAKQLASVLAEITSA